ncbi:MAG: GH51 [uncultured Thermomicrobiales bacterium]|uniref:non-reducing end alpha-L-arabinofuranosidase n=1 Tax=uncultured Thermomicrobiales bacterium TaxID=1645740 RepID=A0A6J4TT63_9BACT|nr:MAG: GH51 [uncultured Thermomicrobiales bacterium]
MPTATLIVRPDAPIGTISPRLYGHFAEHLGRCCYDGVWVGPDSPIPNTDGFRDDVLDALRAMPTPLLRWPGGCYADHYHWRDGIGPPADRPRRLGMSCGLQVPDDNGLGTHEFLRLCALLGAEPYLAGNVGSGTPQELCDWLEYCNAAVDTTLARERAANGSAAAFGVRLWGVGNENWGCGGNYDAATYAREYRRYATMLRHVDPRAELVVCGHEDAWNAELLDTLGARLDLVDHLSIHDYWNLGGPETGFGEDQYHALLAEARATEAFVVRTAALIADATGGKRQIGIALDEWGVWHPEARPWGPDDVVCRDPVTYEQANTLRDALAAALAFEGFHRQCGVLSMANIAQVVNVLQAPVMTDGDQIWLTPTYHAFRLHAPHHGATALPVEPDGGATLPDGTPAVTGTASRSADGFAVSLVNQARHDGAEVAIVCDGAPSGVSARVLAANDPAAQNSIERPDAVIPAPLAVASDGPGRWRVEVPPHSLATVEFRRNRPV